MVQVDFSRIPDYHDCADYPPTVIPGPHPGGHWAKEQCSVCGKHLKWLPKPDSDASKYRRPGTHRELVKKFSPGYCEMCLTPAADIRSPATLEAHHIDRFKNGGSNERSNIWILCTACHHFVELIRRWHGRFTLPAEAQEAPAEEWSDL